MIDDPGSLTDVPGVFVGHHRRRSRGWRTGTTVVFVPDGAVAAVDVRGGGPGTRETDALDPRNLVDRIHAICLTGGSAYGLAAADGVMAELERRSLGVPVGQTPEQVVPVVPTAVIFDLGRGGGFGNRPDASFGERALRGARRRTQRGSVGAGTGARAGWLQGGVGMASTEIECDTGRFRVAALSVVNSSGAVIDPNTGSPWLGGHGLRRPDRAERARLNEHVTSSRSRAMAPMNTTIGIVATDASLDRSEAGRLAQSGHDGLARAIRPAHLLVDGDTIFGLSTGVTPIEPADASLRGPGARTMTLDLLFAAAADVFGRACVDAVVAAEPAGDDPAYRDLCPSAYRR